MVDIEIRVENTWLDQRPMKVCLVGHWILLVYSNQTVNINSFITANCNSFTTNLSTCILRDLPRVRMSWRWGTKHERLSANFGRGMNITWLISPGSDFVCEENRRVCGKRHVSVSIPRLHWVILYISVIMERTVRTSRIYMRFTRKCMSQIELRIDLGLGT